MAMLKTRFSRKLHLVFATMLAITLGLSWYFLDSVKWYEYDVQRIALANNVLQGYQELSRLTFEQYSELNSGVYRSEALEPGVLEMQDRRLRHAVSEVRQGIGAEVAFDNSVHQLGELEALGAIERVVEEFIRNRLLINETLAGGRKDEALSLMQRLDETGIVGHFSQLVQNAINDQKLEVESAEQESITLAHYITSVLPVFMAMLAILTISIVAIFSRSINRSVGALHEGARAFTAGNLSHRIPALREREFARLGEAFNAMARQLFEHRRDLHEANITLEAKIEERTRALRSSNQKLANVDVNRRKLLADISHEFRTPLTVIRGEAEIALRGKSRSREEYRDSFRRIVDQADHTTRLVDDLLFIARADAGEPRLTMRTVSLCGVLETLCEEFSAKAEQRQNTIEYTCMDDKATVHGDAGRLRQVFAILLDNALRYSEEGDKVEVVMGRKDKEIEIRFTDHGIGLTDDEAELAFERFYRGSKAEEHSPGNGLGLPVAKAIIEAHDGRIQLQGVPGEGATATVILPAESRLRVVA
ncbi:MAG: HAMP domain-containing histidine kinase [Xanthomonadales bacterium]|nr:HAMP domain-containing histidine kinase [Xanthomonadales bacterium]